MFFRAGHDDGDEALGDKLANVNVGFNSSTKLRARFAESNNASENGDVMRSELAAAAAAAEASESRKTINNQPPQQG